MVDIVAKLVARRSLSRFDAGKAMFPAIRRRIRSILFALLGFFAMASPVGAADLSVTITNLRNDHGFVDVTLYDHAAGWLDDRYAVGNLTLPARKGSVRAVFRGLRPGRYAVVTTHDENGNGRMDFFLGLPIEGYAFSRDIRPFLSAPAFDRAAISVGSNDLAIAIRMVYPFVRKFTTGRP